jgi:hypothetical protein
VGVVFMKILADVYGFVKFTIFAGSLIICSKRPYKGKKTSNVMLCS